MGIENEAFPARRPTLAAGSSTRERHSPILLRCFIFLIAALGMFAAPPHRWRKHPTSLGNSVLTLERGRDGYLWIGAEDGLYRFDGNHTERVSECPTRRIAQLISMADGGLWVGGDRTFVYNRVFTAVPDAQPRWPRGRTDPPSIYLSRAKGWVRHDQAFLARMVGDHPEEFFVDSRSVEWKPGQYSVVRQRDTTSSEWLIQSPSGSLWAPNIGITALLASGPRFRLSNGGRWRDDFRGITGQRNKLWLLDEHIKSDPPGTTFRFQSPGGSDRVTAATEDLSGNFWIHTPARGLLEMTADPEWETIPSYELDGAGPSQTSRDAAGRVCIATDAGLYRFSEESAAWHLLGANATDYVEVLPLSDHRFLAAARDEGLWILDSEGRRVSRVKDPHSNGINRFEKNYRRLFEDGSGRIWIGHRHVLMQAIPKGPSFQLEIESLPGARDMTSPIDMVQDADGRLWVSYGEGVAWLDNLGNWHRLATDIPIADLRTLSMDAQGTSIWVGYRRNGHFSRIQLAPGKGTVTHFSEAAGYSPKDTRFLRVDSRGWIWRGSDDGVRVCDGIHLEPQDWLHLHAGNGLMGGTVSPNGFLEERDGSVWLSTELGVTHVRPDPQWFAVPAGIGPKITRLDANGKSDLVFDALPKEFPEQTARIQIWLGGLNASPFRDRLFRYRMTSANKQWVTAKGTILELNWLRDGEHQLEVAFVGQGIPVVTTWKFRIGQTPRAPAWTYGISVLAGIAATMFLLRRTRPVKQLQFQMEKQFHAVRFARRGDAASDMIGRVLCQRYRVTRFKGQGGTAWVYEANDPTNPSIRFIIKILDGRVGEAVWTRDAFTTEVAALRSIVHPGVVQLLDSWIDEDGRPILVTQYLDGPTLREIIAHGPCERNRAAAILEYLGDTLQSIHGRGVVHRDLKPENIIIIDAGTKLERPVLIDFGTAGMTGRRQDLVMTGNFGGSMEYMAPERMAGYFSSATDAYSLSVITLELLIGKRPSELAGAPDGILLLAELTENLKSQFGPELVDLISSALASAPEARPAELAKWARQVATAIRSDSGGEPAS